MQAGRLRITPGGIAAINRYDAELGTLETIELVMLARQSRTILELAHLVHRHHEMYYFLDVKFVAKAAAALVNRGFAQYEEPSVPYVTSASNRRQRRHARNGASH